MACRVGAPMGNDASARTFFGVRLGEALERQLAQCPSGDTQWTNADKPCWRRVSRHTQSVALPSALQAVAPTLVVRTVTQAEARIFEVEVEFRSEEARSVERHLRAQFGKPAEVLV